MISRMVKSKKKQKKQETEKKQEQPQRQNNLFFFCFLSYWIFSVVSIEGGNDKLELLTEHYERLFAMQDENLAQKEYEIGTNKHKKKKNNLKKTKMKEEKNNPKNGKEMKERELRNRDEVKEQGVKEMKEQGEREVKK